LPMHWRHQSGSKQEWSAVVHYDIRCISEVASSLLGILRRLQDGNQAQVWAHRSDVAELAACFVDRLPLGLVVIRRDGLNQRRAVSTEVERERELQLVTADSHDFWP